MSTTAPRGSKGLGWRPVQHGPPSTPPTPPTKPLVSLRINAGAISQKPGGKQRGSPTQGGLAHLDPSSRGIWWRFGSTAEASSVRAPLRTRMTQPAMRRSIAPRWDRATKALSPPCLPESRSQGDLAELSFHYKHGDSTGCFGTRPNELCMPEQQRGDSVACWCRDCVYFRRLRVPVVCPLNDPRGDGGPRCRDRGGREPLRSEVQPWSIHRISGSAGRTMRCTEPRSPGTTRQPGASLPRSRSTVVTDPIRISTDNVIISGHRRSFSCAIEVASHRCPGHSGVAHQAKENPPCASF